MVSHSPAPRLSRRSTLGALAALGGALLAPWAGVARAAPAGFGILGRMAPAVHADFWIDAQGRPADLPPERLRGRWVYLKCFQAWCPGCHRHGFPALKTVADAFAGDDRVAVVAVQTVFEGFHFNTRAKVREMQLRYGLAIPMGHDPGDPQGDHRPRTMREYRTGGTPWVVIIEPAGRVVYNDFHVNAERLVEYLRGQLVQPPA